VGIVSVLVAVGIGSVAAGCVESPSSPAREKHDVNVVITTRRAVMIRIEDERVRMGLLSRMVFL
jgi:hypothetical protein